MICSWLTADIIDFTFYVNFLCTNSIFHNILEVYECYIRAVWVDPANARHLIAGPADGVSRYGRIEESYDGVQTWNLAADGMEPAPWAGQMVERFVQTEKGLFAILSSGELWLKRLDASSWHRVLPEVNQIKAIAAEEKIPS